MPSRYVTTPLLLAYMAILVLAAWQEEARPAFLDGAHRMAFGVLDAVGVRAGMKVLGGASEATSELLIARCTIVKGVDSDGTKTRVYPSRTCPRAGLRWKPVIHDHMIVHWTAWLDRGDYEANLSALGDHFCQMHRQRDFKVVELSVEHPLLDYQTGTVRVRRMPLGKVPCRYGSD